jgi:toxin-antitoxin system PIN domain toxin
MWLLDGNLLIALTIDTHEFHQRAQRWFDSQVQQFATCAITEGTLLRVHMQVAQDTSAAAAWSVLEAIHTLPDHVFLDDGFTYTEVVFANISGSKQVTDAWLAELARRHNAQLATLDVALATLHSDVAFLIPT